MRSPSFFLLFALGSALLAGCGSMAAEEHLDRLESQMQNQSILDLRLAHVEDRLTDVESALGELRSTQAAGQQGAGKNKGTTSPAYTVAPPTASPSAQSAAPGQSPLEPAIPSTAAVAPVTPAPGATDAPLVPYPNDPLLSGGNAVAEPMPGFLVGESYQMKSGGRRIATGGQTPADTVSTSGPSLTAPVNPAAPAAAAPSSRTAASSDKAAYGEALALYEKHQTAAAERRFAAFLQQYPQSSLAPNAMYWLGECSYATGKMDSAIMTFKDVAGKFPRHPKAAAALLKAGYAYARLNDMENARFYWQILLDDFPDSAPAALARKRIAEN